MVVTLRSDTRRASSLLRTIASWFRSSTRSAAAFTARNNGSIEEK